MVSPWAKTTIELIASTLQLTIKNAWALQTGAEPVAEKQTMKRWVLVFLCATSATSAFPVTSLQILVF